MADERPSVTPRHLRKSRPLAAPATEGLVPGSQGAGSHLVPGDPDGRDADMVHPLVCPVKDELGLEDFPAPESHGIKIHRQEMLVSFDADLGLGSGIFAGFGLV